ncbi:MAG: hypothetical protein QM817_10765 [Archangium sp.]
MHFALVAAALSLLQQVPDQVLRVDESRRDGYGADLVIIATEIRITEAPNAEAIVTRSRITAKKHFSSASVSTVPRSVAFALVQALAGARPGAAQPPGSVRVQRSDTFRRLDVRVRDDATRELHVFSGSTDTPVRWNLRTSPETAAEVRAEDAQAIEAAWKALSAALAR